jgi:hypothetical protein
VAVSDWPLIRAASIVARAVSPTRAATSTRFAAVTILDLIGDAGRFSTEFSSAWAGSRATNANATALNRLALVQVTAGRSVNVEQRRGAP